MGVYSRTSQELMTKSRLWSEFLSWTPYLSVKLWYSLRLCENGPMHREKRRKRFLRFFRGEFGNTIKSNICCPWSQFLEHLIEHSYANSLQVHDIQFQCWNQIWFKFKKRHSQPCWWRSCYHSSNLDLSIVLRRMRSVPWNEREIYRSLPCFHGIVLEWGETFHFHKISEDVVD